MNKTISATSFIILFLSFSITLSAAGELYGNFKIENSQLHISTTRHREIVPPKRSFKLGDETLVQVDFQKVQIADDKATVGWLADYPNCCTSYPIPLELIIYRDGKIAQVFTGSNLPIWKWQFVNDGTCVAFEQETVHGGLGIHYELREIRTGKLIDSYDGEPTPDAPKWVRDLEKK